MSSVPQGLSAANDPASKPGARRFAGLRWLSALRGRANQTPFRRRLAVTGILVTGLVLFLEAAGLLAPIERRIYDYRARLCQFNRPQGPQYVHIDIDDGSLDTIGSWPWPRRVMGDVIKDLSDAGAKTIALDVMFSEERSFDDRTGEVLGLGEQTADDLEFARLLKIATEGENKPQLLVPISFSWRANDGDRVKPLLRKLLAKPENLKAEGEHLKAELASSGASALKIKEAIDNSFFYLRQEAMLDAILASTSDDPALLRKDLLGDLASYNTSNLHQVFEREFAKSRAIKAIWKIADAPEELLPDSLQKPPILIRAESESPPIKSVANCARGYGFVDFVPDEDGVARCVPLLAICRGHVVPQFALALACNELGVNIRNPEEFKADRDAIDLTPPGGPRIHIPLFTRYGDRYDTPIGASLLIPFSNHNNPNVRRRPFGWVWQIAHWRIELERNRQALKQAFQELTLRSSKSEPFDENLPDQIKRLLSDQDLIDWLADAKVAVEKDHKAVDAKRWLECALFLETIPKQNRIYEGLIRGRVEDLRREVGGKVVLIGMTATGLALDSNPTPLQSRSPGVVVQGEIFSALMSGALWTPSSAWVTYLLIVFAGLVATRTMVQVMPGEGPRPKRGWRAVLHPLEVQLSPWRATALGVGLMIAWVFFNAVYFFGYRGWVVPMSPPVIAVLLVWSFGIAGIAAERFRVVHALRGYVDKRLVNFLGRHPERDLFAPKQQELTICFSDLQGFTTLTQALGEKMVELLQAYLSRMVPVIRKHGVVNKFMGDGIMFFFGAPDPDPDHVQHAVQCVLEMQEELSRFNDEMAEKGFPRLTMRCGVNTGPAFVGDAGPDAAREYTAIGDTTNVAARLESANKDFGTLVIVAESVRNKIASDQYFFRPVGKLKLRNRKGGVMTYELACRTSEASEKDRKEAEVMQAMISAFGAAAFEGCLQLLDKMDQLYGKNKLRARYRERCEEYRAGAVPEGFEGQIIEQD